jgi:hypothetical protein
VTGVASYGWGLGPESEIDTKLFPRRGSLCFQDEGAPSNSRYAESTGLREKLWHGCLDNEVLC